MKWRSATGRPASTRPYRRPPKTGPAVCTPCNLKPKSGFGVGALGFGLWDLGFGLWDLGFRVWDLGFRVWDLGFRLPEFWFRSYGLGCRI